MPAALDYFRYWGKARPDTPAGAQWHPLPYHCMDVAAVGVEYLRRSPSVRRYLVERLGLVDEALLEQWLAFWLALHDLGKFSEAFQGQKQELFRQLRGRAPQAAKTYRLRHDTLGFLFWKEVVLDKLLEQEWFGPESGELHHGLDCWARAVMGHHGQPPVASSDDWGSHFDRNEDRRAAMSFVDWVRERFLSAELVSAVRQWDAERFLSASRDLSWWIAGVAVLADWLGSNTEYFRYEIEHLPLETYWDRARRIAVQALDHAGVLPVEPSRGLGFAELFPSIAAPSPLQHWAATCPLAQGPQIYLLEDVTGAGKTEAAITLAYRLMDAGEADGFFIGLPTMATANAMYGRVAGVYRCLFAHDASLALAHGQRNLVEAFAATVLPRGIDEKDAQQQDDTATARCTAWLADHNKRALLASAGVGTIDQALLAVLHSRHQSLRLLGLFRKVLVVDEVHACDSYMQRVLETLLEFHGRAGGSVILLSATLPRQMKQSLLAAFARGRKRRAPQCESPAYPLATSWRDTEPGQLSEQSIATRDAVRRSLAVKLESNESVIVAAIQAALDQGQCVCWMRNTVADALAARALFEGRVPAERITLFHARFALQDRLRIERIVLALFGPRSTPERRSGRLVIATQVAEQSLDADWDFLVSDLAPIDRLIQRAGRLRRHLRDVRGRRISTSGSVDGRGEPCLWVYAPEWQDEPKADWFKAAFPKAAAVYQHHGQLWLTAQALRAGRIAMPEDARPLIESVFGQDTVIPAGLNRSAQTAEADDYASISVAQQNTLTLNLGYERGGIDWWSEAQTPSRLGEATTSVLLARWEGGRLGPWAQGDFAPRHAWAYSSVRVAERLIARTVEPTDTVRKAALDALLQSLPNQGRWSVILVLEETSEGWVGEGWSKPGGGAEQRLRWLYDRRIGLLQVKAPGVVPPGAIPVITGNVQTPT